jgi:hypothetical protein
MRSMKSMNPRRMVGYSHFWCVMRDNLFELSTDSSGKFQGVRKRVGPMIASWRGEKDRTRAINVARRQIGRRLARYGRSCSFALRHHHRRTLLAFQQLVVIGGRYVIVVSSVTVWSMYLHLSPDLPVSLPRARTAKRRVTSASIGTSTRRGPSPREMVRLMEELYRLKPKEALSLAGLVRISDHPGDQRRARRPCLPAARRALVRPT